MFFYIDSNYKVCGSPCQYRFKRGDDLELCLIFIGKKGYPVNPEFVDVIFGAKLPGDYTGTFLAYTNEFIPGQTSAGDPCLRGILKLNSSGLASCLGTDDYKELSAEFEFNRLNVKSTSQTLTLHIHNDLIRGTEGIPTDAVPDYATKSYVDTAVSNLVSEAMEEDVHNISGIRDEASQARNEAEEARIRAEAAAEEAENNAAVATGKAEEAAQSGRDALSSKNSAAESALSAAYSAKSVSEAATGMQGFVDSAAGSAADAREAANAAQAIAGSLGNEVAEARAARDQALASAADAEADAVIAMQKAKEAETSAGKAQSSVTSAADSAAQARQDAGFVEARAEVVERISAVVQSTADAVELDREAAETAAGNAVLSESVARENAEGAAESAEQAAESAAEAGLSVEDVRRIAAEVLAMIKEIVPPRLNYDGNHFYFNKFTEPEYPDDSCVYPYAYLKKMVGGKDNYQLWLEAGNTGTLEDFMESMKGPAGDQQELLEIKEQLESKSEAIEISAADYENMADKNPRTLYIIN